VRERGSGALPLRRGADRGFVLSLALHLLIALLLHRSLVQLSNDLVIKRCLGGLNPKVSVVLK
jgi:hypothetical protein